MLKSCLICDKLKMASGSLKWPLRLHLASACSTPLRALNNFNIKNIFDLRFYSGKKLSLRLLILPPVAPTGHLNGPLLNYAKNYITLFLVKSISGPWEAFTQDKGWGGWGGLCRFGVEGLGELGGLVGIGGLGVRGLGAWGVWRVLGFGGLGGLGVGVGGLRCFCH